MGVLAIFEKINVWLTKLVPLYLKNCPVLGLDTLASVRLLNPAFKGMASVIPYPAIVVGTPVKELNAPSNASVIPYPAIVVGLLRRSENAKG